MRNMDNTQNQYGPWGRHPHTDVGDARTLRSGRTIIATDAVRAPADSVRASARASDPASDRPRQFGRGRGRGGRGRRGDVRAAILLLLADNPMHGYELIQQIRERSDDVWRPSPGSIYPALSQLEDEGLITIEKVEGRKTAQLTEAGRAYLADNDLGDPFAAVMGEVGEQALDLRALIGQLMGAAGQVAMVGTPEQARRAGEVLTEARKAMYRILAEDDTAATAEEADSDNESE